MRVVNIAIRAVHVEIHRCIVNHHIMAKENHPLRGNIHIYPANKNIFIIPVLPFQRERRSLVSHNSRTSTHIAIEKGSARVYRIFSFHINRKLQWCIGNMNKIPAGIIRMKIL